MRRRRGGAAAGLLAAAAGVGSVGGDDPGDDRGVDMLRSADLLRYMLVGRYAAWGGTVEAVDGGAEGMGLVNCVQAADQSDSVAFTWQPDGDVCTLWPPASSRTMVPSWAPDPGSLAFELVPGHVDKHSRVWSPSDNEVGFVRATFFLRQLNSVRNVWGRYLEAWKDIIGKIMAPAEPYSVDMQPHQGTPKCIPLEPWPPESPNMRVMEVGQWEFCNMLLHPGSKLMMTLSGARNFLVINAWAGVPSDANPSDFRRAVVDNLEAEWKGEDHQHLIGWMVTVGRKAPTAMVIAEGQRCAAGTSLVELRPALGGSSNSSSGWLTPETQCAQQVVWNKDCGMTFYTEGSRCVCVKQGSHCNREDAAGATFWTWREPDEDGNVDDKNTDKFAFKSDMGAAGEMKCANAQCSADMVPWADDWLHFACDADPSGDPDADCPTCCAPGPPLDADGNPGNGPACDDSMCEPGKGWEPAPADQAPVGCTCVTTALPGGGGGNEQVWPARCYQGGCYGDANSPACAAAPGMAGAQEVPGMRAVKCGAPETCRNIGGCVLRECCTPKWHEDIPRGAPLVKVDSRFVYVGNYAAHGGTVLTPAGAGGLDGEQLGPQDCAEAAASLPGVAAYAVSEAKCVVYSAPPAWVPDTTKDGWVGFMAYELRPDSPLVRITVLASGEDKAKAFAAMIRGQAGLQAPPAGRATAAPLHCELTSEGLECRESGSSEAWQRQYLVAADVAPAAGQSAAAAASAARAAALAAARLGGDGVDGWAVVALPHSGARPGAFCAAGGVALTATADAGRCAQAVAGDPRCSADWYAVPAIRVCGCVPAGGSCSRWAPHPAATAYVAAEAAPVEAAAPCLPCPGGWAVRDPAPPRGPECSSRASFLYGALCGVHMCCDAPPGGGEIPVTPAPPPAPQTPAPAGGVPSTAQTGAATAAPEAAAAAVDAAPYDGVLPPATPRPPVYLGHTPVPTPPRAGGGTPQPTANDSGAAWINVPGMGPEKKSTIGLLAVAGVLVCGLVIVCWVSLRSRWHRSKQDQRYANVRTDHSPGMPPVAKQSGPAAAAADRIAASLGTAAVDKRRDDDGDGEMQERTRPGAGTAAPEWLRVDSCPKWPALIGVYRKQPAIMRDMPWWRRVGDAKGEADGGGGWLANDKTQDVWMFSLEEEHFRAGVGWVKSQDPHGGQWPQSLGRWASYDFSTASWQPENGTRVSDMDLPADASPGRVRQAI